MTRNFKSLRKDGSPIKTLVTLHPGEVLDMELKARGISKSDFAASIGLKAANLSELLHQRRHVSAGLALKLEAILGIDAEFWMRVQSGYDLEIERKKGRLSPKNLLRPGKRSAVEMTKKGKDKRRVKV